MRIGIPRETAAGETRVAVTPETAKKLKAQGHALAVQSGAGVAASVTDEAFAAAGAALTGRWFTKQAMNSCCLAKVESTARSSTMTRAGATN